jgi:HPr kinase/phosphorylase
MTGRQTILHGACVSVGGKGVLILGPPGAGKSDLALKLIDQPGYGLSSKLTRSELVADDQVVIARRGKKLAASAPPALGGKLEIRGLGIVDVKAKPKVMLTLVVKLQAHAHIERMPDSSTFEILGISLPVVEIDGATTSAMARLRAAVNWLVKRS